MEWQCSNGCKSQYDGGPSRLVSAEPLEGGGYEVNDDGCGELFAVSAEEMEALTAA